jgi:hypothetical protein
LCARSISVASFDRAALLGAALEGDGVGDPVGSADAAIATAVGVVVTGVLDLSTPAEMTGACGLVMYPASATPTASAETSAKGASVKSLPPGIGRIFIERDRSSASNGAQRHLQSRTRV